MAEIFNCDFDPDTELTVRQDPDGFVEITVEDPTVPSVPGLALAAYLQPESARRFARAVTLASFAVEGEPLDDVLQAEAEAMKETLETGAPAEPCPEDNEPCDAACANRPECHRAAVADLFRPVETPAEGGRVDKEALFLEARELAGPAASLDDVLKVAAYLAT